MTKGRAIDEMLRWIDQATINGETPDTSQTADIKDRAAHMLDGVVKLLASQFRIPAVYTAVRDPVENMLGQAHNAVRVLPEEPFTARANGARSFYIEVCGDATVTVKQGENTLYSEEVCSDERYLPVRANIDAEEADVHMSVTANYPASVRYAAMYKNSFLYDDMVQPFIPYVPYTLPPDFREYEKCVRTSDRRIYEDFDDVRREGLRTFLLPFYARGQFDFHYWRNPADVPPDAEDDTPIEIAPQAESLVGLKLAADVARGTQDMQNIAYWLDAEFSSRINNIAAQERGGRGYIQTRYSMM